MESRKLKRNDSFMLVDHERLIEARGDRKPAHVAAEIGVSRHRMSEWENGRKRVPLSVLRELARIYEKPLEYFLAEKNFGEIYAVG